MSSGQTDLIRNIKLALLIIAGFSVLFVVVKELKLFIQTDRCLDSGGRWNSVIGQCEKGH